MKVLINTIPKNWKYQLGFEVWINGETQCGIGLSQCMATFTYWQECLDYKEYILNRGVNCHIRTKQMNNTFRTELRECKGE